MAHTCLNYYCLKYVRVYIGTEAVGRNAARGLEFVTFLSDDRVSHRSITRIR